MFKKEMTILVGKHSKNKIIATDTFYYRFYEVVNGKLEKNALDLKRNQSTMDIYEAILSEFLVDNEKEKLLTYMGYSIFKLGKKEYLGIKMQNSEKEKLNIYFTYNALDALKQLVKLIEILKYRDFYEYAINSMEKEEVEKIVICPSFDRSSINYILDNKEYNSLRIQKQLGYYYRKNDYTIDEVDLWNICNIIRIFINFNLENHPRYEYSDVLRIKSRTKFV